MCRYAEQVWNGRGAFNAVNCGTDVKAWFASYAWWWYRMIKMGTVVKVSDETANGSNLWSFFLLIGNITYFCFLNKYTSDSQFKLIWTPKFSEATPDIGNLNRRATTLSTTFRASFQSC